MLTWQTEDRSKHKYQVPADEPDKAQWVAYGFDCLIVRGPSGALCGYVGVPPTHSAYEKEYDGVYATNGDYVDVHGGLTFSNHCNPTEDPSKHICHMHEFAANPKVWWLGFDCAHSGDIRPAYGEEFFGNCMYRSFDYVQREVERLAIQLVESA